MNPPPPLDPDKGRRRELSAFLRGRRARLRPADAGLPAGTRRRTPGLRREEVAQLSGVGTTWYAWLEQARDIRVSVEALGRLARALRLDVEERRHLFRLAQHELPAVSPPRVRTVSAALEDVLHSLGDQPAYYRDVRWNLLAWNPAAAWLLDLEALIAEPSPHAHNLLRQTFLHLPYRRTVAAWEKEARATTAKFRAECGHLYGVDPELTAMVDDLRRHSPEFAAFWTAHEVQPAAPGIKEFTLPGVGRAAYSHTTFHVADQPEIVLVVYTLAARKPEVGRHENHQER